MTLDSLSSLSVATLSLTEQIDFLNLAIVPMGGSMIARGSIGMGKTQANTRNLRDQQAADPEFGGSLMNLANAESIDLRGLPQLDPVYSRYGMPPWLHPVPAMGLRGCFPCLCPEELRGDRGTWSPELTHAYDTKEEQLKNRKLIPYPRGIIILDECLQVIEESVLLSLAQLLDEHRIGEWGVPLENWAVLGLTNRVTDQAAVRELYAHVRNRIAMVEVTSDRDATDAYWEAKGMHFAFRYFARAQPDDVFTTTVPAEGGDQFCTARSWERAQEAVMTWLLNKGLVPLEELGEAELDPENAMIPAIVAMYCGNATALGFKNYLENLKHRPDFDSIVKAPMKARLPSENGVIVAVIEMCVGKATVQNLEKICIYMMRDEMPDMMRSVFCFRLANRMQAQTLFMHNAFMRLVAKAGPSCKQLLFGAENAF